MTSNLTTCFWGLDDGEHALDAIKEILGRHSNHGAYVGDNLVTFGRNLSFLHDEQFMAAFKSIIHPSNTVGYGIMWRIYMYCWAAQSCLNKEGDFVECGVSSGTSSSIMCNYLNFSLISKVLYLYDAWGADPRIDSTHYGFNDQTLNEVKARFSQYSNVRLIKGFVPDSFSSASPDKISFLHIDMNNAEAELSALDFLFDRVVPGGIVLFDDYGATGYASSKAAEDAWLHGKGYSVGELPTGQGLVIK